MSASPGPDPHPVFVYGTLQPGGRYWARFAAPYVTGVRPARVRGTLYDLPAGYPALVPAAGPGEDGSGADAPWVHGVLLLSAHPGFLPGLDRLEGFDPARPPAANLYQRVLLPVWPDHPEGPSLTPTAAPHRAWVYVMESARLPSGARLLPAGRWP